MYVHIYVANEDDCDSDLVIDGSLPQRCPV